MLVQRDPHTGITSTSNQEVWQYVLSQYGSRSHSLHVPPAVPCQGMLILAYPDEELVYERRT